MLKLDGRLQSALKDFNTHPDDDGEIEVSVQFDGDVRALQHAGFRLGSSIEGHALGSIHLSALDTLASLSEVRCVRRTPSVGVALDQSIPAINVPAVWAGSPSYKGRGVIVGIVDSGIDIAHKNFRKANGGTRILRLWDQTKNPPPANTRPPSRFKLPGVNGGQLIDVNYGAEYTSAQLDALLFQTALPGSSPPLSAYPGLDDLLVGDINPQDKKTVGHGSHVAGIAVGNGQEADGCHGPDVYIGVAPEADIVVVKCNGGPKKLLHAFEYMIHFAANGSNFPDGQPRPIVINTSLGMPPLGLKEDTESFNAQVDHLLEGSSSRAIVAAAMNWAAAGAHASIKLPAGQLTPTPLPFHVFEIKRDVKADRFDLRFEGSTAVEVALKPPGGAAFPLSAPAQATRQVTVDGHIVNYGTGAGASPAGTSSLWFTLDTPSPVGEIRRGIWTIELREPTGRAVSVEAWIKLEENDMFPRFTSSDPTNTVGSPARARNVIAVGNYVARADDPHHGTIEKSSGQGRPVGQAGVTTDTVKPDVVAPGTGIFAPLSQVRHVDHCSDCCLDFYVVDSGTSMAAPHVAGVVALMFERNKTLTFSEIRKLLKQTARNISGHTLPDHMWGAGLVDALAAVNAVVPSAAPAIGLNLPPLVPDPVGATSPPPAGGPLAPIKPRPIRSEDSSDWWIGRLPRLADRRRALDALLPDSAVLRIVMALVSTHFDEVRRLIDANRRVAAVWRRNGGPVLVRHLMAAPIDPASAVPAIVDGYSVRALLLRLISILQRYGSDALRSDASRHGELILALPGTELASLDRLVLEKAVS